MRKLFKNLTIRQISIYINVVILTLYIIVLFCIVGFDYVIDHFLLILIIYAVASVLGFISIRYLLERYVFSKIKTIYKIINKSKLGKGDKKNLDMNNKRLDDVNDEVIKWAEKTDKQLKSLKSLAKYRKNFVGNISHELKTPIFSIQGYLHTLLDGGMYDDEINISYLQRAAQNTERLKNIVEDLESISRLESGELILEMEKFDIKALVQEVIQDLSVVSSKRNIEIKLKDDSPSFQVLADKNSIRQVLNNLIVNSIKYGKQEGITRIGLYDMDDSMLVEVSDDGIGIGQKHLKHLFDRFYRVDESRSREAGGSGLGLSIVKHIIEAHRQTINVRSRRNVGSTFGFTLKKAK